MRDRLHGAADQDSVRVDGAPRLDLDVARIHPDVPAEAHRRVERDRPHVGAVGQPQHPAEIAHRAGARAGFEDDVASVAAPGAHRAGTERQVGARRDRDLAAEGVLPAAHVDGARDRDASRRANLADDATRAEACAANRGERRGDDDLAGVRGDRERTGIRAEPGAEPVGLDRSVEDVHVAGRRAKKHAAPGRERVGVAPEHADRRRAGRRVDGEVVIGLEPHDAAARFLALRARRARERDRPALDRHPPTAAALGAERPGGEVAIRVRRLEGAADAHGVATVDVDRAAMRRRVDGQQTRGRNGRRAVDRDRAAACAPGGRGIELAGVLDGHRSGHVQHDRAAVARGDAGRPRGRGIDRAGDGDIGGLDRDRAPGGPRPVAGDRLAPRHELCAAVDRERLRDLDRQAERPIAPRRRDAVGIRGARPPRRERAAPARLDGERPPEHDARRREGERGSVRYARRGRDDARVGGRLPRVAERVARLRGGVPAGRHDEREDDAGGGARERSHRGLMRSLPQREEGREVTQCGARRPGAERSGSMLTARDGPP